jgi:predicted NAD-dependent protein-ADP-ribosyltransferase YbiA (DUF1768 family)
MTNTIELFNPIDKPFGKLSNHSYHPITINGKKYDTVTNYIYSNMLTAPNLSTIIQNTKIRGSKGVNQELLSAIDFLIQPGQKTTTLSEQGINDDQMVTKIITYTRAKHLFPDKKTYKKWKKDKNYDYLKKLVESWDKRKKNEYYKKALIVEDSRLSGGEKTKDSWVQYAKTGELLKEEKELEQRRDFQVLISNEVRKPFDSIDLVLLKKQLITESTMNQMGIYKIYNKNVQLELFNVISNAIQKGYEVRIKSSKKLQNILLKTGNLPIQYESDDPFIGIGSDGRGENLVGKVLQQLRHNLREKDNEMRRESQIQAKYKKIYDIYIAYSILRIEIKDNKKQLKEYLGLTYKQIITKFGLKNLTSGIPTQDTIIGLYKKDKLPKVIMSEIYHPGTLVINARKLWMGGLRNQLLRDKDDIIFNSYLEYMLRSYEEEINNETDRQFTKQLETGMSKSNKNNIKQIIIDNIIARQKTDLPSDQLLKIKERVIDLFKLGMLSASLSDRIDSDIENLQIPSDEIIKEAEMAEIISVPIQTENIKKQNIKKQEDVSSNDSSTSSAGSPVTKILKQAFKDEKVNKKDIVDEIISIKGGNRSHYNDWSLKDLQQRLDVMGEEKWGSEKDIEDNDINSIYVQPYGQPISIFKDENKNPQELNPFNPESYTGMLSIDNKYYPTIQHYMIAKLIANTGTKKVVDSYGSISFKKGMGIINAQKSILVDFNGTSSNKPGDFLVLQLAGEAYDRINNETTTLLLSMYTVTSLNKKFEDKSLQDLLLLTGDSTINWNSPQNFYLGVGNEKVPGKNYVGTTMMDMRKKLKETRSTEEEVSINVNSLIRIVKKNSFIMTWIEMRLGDMCGVVYKFQQYLKYKDGLDIDVNEEERFHQLIKFVLNTIYKPFSSLVKLTDIPNTKTPDFFINMLKKCKGMSSGIQPVKKMDDKGIIRYNSEIKERRVKNEREIARTESEFWGGVRIEHTQSESDEFNKYQRQEWVKFLDDLNTSNTPQQDKSKTMNEFKNQQQKEYNDFWGIETTKKTTDEISRHNHKISELKRELNEYILKARRVEQHYNNVNYDIAQIYWNRISTMLSTLILNTGNPTDSNISEILVKAEMLNTEKTNCVRIIANEQDNCIVSAVLNLLKGIMEFKEEFAGSLELDEDDVKLAESIILNNKFNPTQTNDYSEQNSDNDEPFDVGPEGSFPDLDSKEGDEYGEEPDDYDENPYFSFKGEKQKYGSSGDLAKVEQQVMLISIKNSKNMAIEIMKTLQTIKNSNISPKIKQNRINFFATIR